MGSLLGQNKFLENALKYGFSLWGPPKTGQTTSYRNEDDGDLKKGYPKNPPRFKDNGDGTISDNATGLMWVKDPPLVTKFWNVAVDYCDGLNYAGHSDWRLPNVNELAALIDRGRDTPAINTTFFPNTANNDYWTSTTQRDNINNAWAVHFEDGEVSYQLKTRSNYARPVRGGI